MALGNDFIKAAASGQGGNCLEARVDAPTGMVQVRHSRNPEGTMLTYTPDEWRAFLTGVRAGEFDLA